MFREMMCNERDGRAIGWVNRPRGWLYRYLSFGIIILAGYKGLKVFTWISV